jgi:PAS domain S-box-containing protein
MHGEAMPRDEEAGDAVSLAARESEARLRALADNLPHAMIYQMAASADGVRRRFTFVGQSCARLNGVPAEAVLQDPRRLYELVAPEHRQAMAAAEQAALAQVRPFDLEVAFIRPDGERRWSRISSAPRILADGSTLWDGIQLDITDSRRSQEALATEQNRLALVVEATGLGLWDYDIATGHLHWDEAMKAIFGLPADAEVDYAAYLAGLHPEDRERVTATFNDAIQAGATGYQTEHRIVTRGGEVRWVIGCARIIRTPDGEALQLIGSAQDITERKLAEERLQLMVHELNHRVKNSMAVVQAITARTLRDDAAPEAARRNLTSRLLALARAHDLLTAESWAGADLATVATRSLTALAADHARVSITGPRVRLRPPAAVTFALVFHELATNAVKYGALSNETGCVSLAWSLQDDGRRLHLTWTETGGPPVVPPSRRGFGVQLIERGLAAEGGGEVRLNYRPEGLVCSIEGLMERLGPVG